VRAAIARANEQERGGREEGQERGGKQTLRKNSSTTSQPAIESLLLRTSCSHRSSINLGPIRVRKSEGQDTRTAKGKEEKGKGKDREEDQTFVPQ